VRPDLRDDVRPDDGYDATVTRHTFARAGYFFISPLPCKSQGHAVAQLVEALRYMPEGRELYSRWRHWNFSLT